MHSGLSYLCLSARCMWDSWTLCSAAEVEDPWLYFRLAITNFVCNENEKQRTGHKWMNPSLKPWLTGDREQRKEAFPLKNETISFEHTLILFQGVGGGRRDKRVRHYDFALQSSAIALSPRAPDQLSWKWWKRCNLVPPDDRYYHYNHFFFNFIYSFKSD